MLARLVFALALQHCGPNACGVQSIGTRVLAFRGWGQVLPFAPRVLL